MADDQKRQDQNKADRTRTEHRDEVERTGRAPDFNRQQQADTGRGSGDRHVQQGGDRRSQQIDENQSQSDRNPREGGNRQQQQGGDKPRQMGDVRSRPDKPPRDNKQQR